MCMKKVDAEKILFDKVTGFLILIIKSFSDDCIT